MHGADATKEKPSDGLRLFHGGRVFHHGVYGRAAVLATIGIAPPYPLSEYGRVCDKYIRSISTAYANASVDNYIVMPNHIHLLITLAERINPFPTGACDIPNIIGKFKAGVTRRVGNAFMHSAAKTIWQTSYHDHIIRDRADYDAIWAYSADNPRRWREDTLYCEE